MDEVTDRPEPLALMTAWTPQPVALALAVALAVGYARGLRRYRGSWSRGRTGVFAGGLALLVWTCCGPAQVYADSLYWVWTAQTLTLWLAVPILILAGHPVQLARAGARTPRLDSALASRPARIVGNPLVGPALVPLLSGVLFFGPVPGWAITAAPIGWLVQLVLLALGALMVLPLAGLDEGASSLAVGLSLAIGSFELVLDALPGVVLRLRQGLATTWFDHRAVHAWSPDVLRDQRTAGAILWAVAELLDLPFLLFVYRRWLRADARDAAQVDAVLEAERAARRGLAEPNGADGTDGLGGTDDSDGAGGTASPGGGPPGIDGDAPWWLTDPAMRRRMAPPPRRSTGR